MPLRQAIYLQQDPEMHQMVLADLASAQALFEQIKRYRTKEEIDKAMNAYLTPAHKKANASAIGSADYAAPI